MYNLYYVENKYFWIYIDSVCYCYFNKNVSRVDMFESLNVLFLM